MSKLHKIVATTAFVGTVAVGGSQIADADTYTIKSGDTLWDIAVNNGTTVDALMQDNNLSSHLIYPGDKLNYSSSSSSSVEKLAQVKNDGYYTIALGDTLGTVADKFGTSVDNLVEINNLSNPHLVYVGQVIKVDGNAAPKATPAVAQAAPVQAAPVARVQAAPVAQTRVAAPAAQTKVAAPAAQTKVAAPAAQTKVAAPAVQTKAAAPAAQTKAAAPAAQTRAAAPAAQTKAAAPAAQTKAAATTAPATQTKAATPAPKAETKAAAPAAQTKAAAPAAQTKAVTTTAPKTETKAAAQTPAPAAQTKAATPAPKAETKAATQTPAPAAQTKAATPAPAAQTKPAAITTPSGSKNAAIYQAALAQVGRYQDCTMLVTNALKSVGINYHDWPAGYMKLGTQVSASQAQAGDLIYYANGGTGLAHIAVYAGNGQAVHGGWLGNQTVVNTANVGSGPVYIRVK